MPAPSNPPVNLLVITDNTIRMMLGDPRYLAVAPCLGEAVRAYKKALPNCTRCQAKMQQLVSRTNSGIRDCISRLSSAARTALKQLLNARQVRIIKYSGGKKVVLTF